MLSAHIYDCFQNCKDISINSPGLMISYHGEPDPLASKTNEAQDCRTCPCGTIFKSFSETMAHAVNCSLNVNLQCPACQMPFKRKDNLRAHMRNNAAIYFYTTK